MVLVTSFPFPLSSFELGVVPLFLIDQSPPLVASYNLQWSVGHQLSSLELGPPPIACHSLA